MLGGTRVTDPLNHRGVVTLIRKDVAAWTNSETTLGQLLVKRELIIYNSLLEDSSMVHDTLLPP